MIIVINLSNISKKITNFNVYLSPDLGNSSIPSGSCPLLSAGNLTLGSYNKDEIISYSKLQILKQDYESNYENLKSQLGIPPIFDFAIKGK